MTKAYLTERERDILHDYHIPGCRVVQTRAHDDWHFSKGNSIEHERKKFEIAFELYQNGHHFIMEAERNHLDETGARRIVDIVDLSTGDEYEVETDMHRAVRFVNDAAVTIIPVGWGKEDKKWMDLVQAAKAKAKGGGEQC